MKWIRQIFCRHKYQCRENCRYFWLNARSYWVCTKCGKKDYRFDVNLNPCDGVTFNYTTET